MAELEKLKQANDTFTEITVRALKDLMHYSTDGFIVIGDEFSEDSINYIKIEQYNHLINILEVNQIEKIKIPTSDIKSLEAARSMNIQTEEYERDRQKY